MDYWEKSAGAISTNLLLPVCSCAQETVRHVIFKSSDGLSVLVIYSLNEGLKLNFYLDVLAGGLCSQQKEIKVYANVTQQKLKEI